MSLLIISSKKTPCKIVTMNGVNLHSLESALVEATPTTYKTNPVSVQLAL